MKRHPDPRPIASIVRREPKIDPKPEYQRSPVWSRKQKQLLIDTILRDLDIPKFYLRDLTDGQYESEVVDGQQRLRAIWGFRKGEFSLDKDADPVNGVEIAGLTYDNLPEDLKDAFDSYSLDVVILQDCSLEEVEEMFVRLQNGSTLRAAEKRNALPGQMKYFIRKVAQHSLFQHCGFKNKRFQFDHVAAQCMLLEKEGEPRNIKNEDLNKLYLDNQEFDEESSEAKRLQRVLNFLDKAFPESTPELERYNVISTYLLASMLLSRYAISGYEERFGKWFINFETKRLADFDKPEDQRDPELVSYQNATSHSTDAIESLEYRQKMLSRDFFLTHPEILLKDDDRAFTEEQKLAIFRRDGGICKLQIKCKGLKMGWDDDWHIDHKIPYIKGGKTSVENGQIACAACNLSKGSTI
ncbi:hypothetical protein A2947_03250 [Candidatus Peribacteria bacterium RIFCSPLOWO2_01_FULL_54_110]|nr:MAG: hypothetical protein A2947_03250 [Candidatus Peribacteria bacterium RIFCSPLOWO2_01_FULL_54_110]